MEYHITTNTNVPVINKPMAKITCSVSSFGDLERLFLGVDWRGYSNLEETFKK